MGNPILWLQGFLSLNLNSNQGNLFLRTDALQQVSKEKRKKNKKKNKLFCYRMCAIECVRWSMFPSANQSVSYKNRVPHRIQLQKQFPADCSWTTTASCSSFWSRQADKSLSLILVVVWLQQEANLWSLNRWVLKFPA